VRQIKLATRQLLAHVNIVNRIVSYRIIHICRGGSTGALAPVGDGLPPVGEFGSFRREWQDGPGGQAVTKNHFASSFVIT